MKRDTADRGFDIQAAGVLSNPLDPEVTGRLVDGI
jgi:hypothetical protein